MRVSELIKELQKYDEDIEVCCSSDTGYSWWSYPINTVALCNTFKDGEVSVEGKEKRLCLMAGKS